MADIDAKLARSTSDIVAAMLTPATLAAETDAALLSADELEKKQDNLCDPALDSKAEPHPAQAGDSGGEH